MKKSVRHLSLGAAIAAALGLTGCQTTDIFTPGQGEPALNQSSGAMSSSETESQGTVSSEPESDISLVFDPGNNYEVDVYGPPEDFYPYEDSFLESGEDSFDPEENYPEAVYGPPAYFGLQESFSEEEGE